MIPDGLFELARYRWHPFATPIVLAATTGLAMGALLVVRERRVKESVLFFVIAFFASVWLYAFTGMYCSTDPRTALGWAKLAYLGVPFLPAAIYHFSVHVLRLGGRHFQAVRAVWATSAVFSALIVGTDRFIPDVYEYSWGYYPRYGRAAAVYLLFFFGVMGSTLWYYFRFMRAATPGSLYRQRSEAFFFAFSVLMTGSIDYLPKYGIGVYPFGYASVFCFLVLAARTIWTYRFVDITPAFAAQQILETMGEPLLVCDDHGLVRIANHAFQSSFEWSRQELVGLRMEDLLIEEPAERRRLASLLKKGDVRDAEFTFTTKNGRAVHVGLSISQMKDGRGFSQGYVAVCRDVTERKQLEKRMWEMTRSLENSVKERTSELESKIRELEWLNEIMMGREERILELKERLEKTFREDVS